MDSFVKYTYVRVAILNILLFDLDRHLHQPFCKMVALKAMDDS